MAVPNSNFDGDLASATLREYRPKLVDNITQKIELLRYFKAAGRIQTWDGGDPLTENLMYKLGSLQSYEDFETINYQPTNGITVAQYPMKSVVAPIVISRGDMLKNAGKSRIIELLKTRVLQAELTMAEGIEAMLFSDGLGNGGKDWLGLGAFIETGATTVAPTRQGTGTVGNINRSTATNAFWKNWASDGAKASAAGDNLLSAMTQMNYKLRSATDMIMTTDAVMALYESLLRGFMQFEQKQIGDASFGKLLYKGIPMDYSEECGTGLMYWLNSEFIKFRPHVKSNFVTTDFRKANNQMAEYADVLLDGNLTVSNSSRLGVIHAID